MARDAEVRGSVDPPVKWAGGKRLLAPILSAAAPPGFGRYFEPFAGSGAVFFRLAPARATLNDTNVDLINFYRQLKAVPAQLRAAIRRWPNDSETFYRVRASRPRSNLGRAARFYYLNRTAFGGLFRTNRAGIFNVPFGSNDRKVLGSAQAWNAASAQLKTASLQSRDFVAACAPVQAADFVYLDPPYSWTHNVFARYGPSRFQWSDQVRVRALVDELTERGAYVIVTHLDDPAVRRLYEGYQIVSLRGRNSLAGGGASACLKRQVVIANYRISLGDDG